MIKILAFDFDNTIIKSHSITNNWTPKVVETMTIKQIIDATSELFNYDKFMMFIGYQYRHKGAKFAVVSYGHRAVIEAFLRRLGILYVFDHILTPVNFGLLDGYNVFKELRGKNNMLDRLSKHYNAFPHEILFMDDNQLNINMANASKYMTIKVNPETGLVINDGYVIEQFLKTPSYQISNFGDNKIIDF